MKTHKFIAVIIVIISVFSILFSVFYFFPNIFADTEKEYRNGKIVYISGKNYIIANNKEFVEILEITADDKLAQVSEVRGMDKVEDIYVSQEETGTFLIAAAGRYLIKYDINDPIKPKIVLKRDLYEWNRGKPTIGYINSLAGNDNYIFVSGPKGTYGLDKDNLFFYKQYGYEAGLGLAATADYLLVVEEKKAVLYNISSGEAVKEYSAPNSDKRKLSPDFGYSGEIYLPADNSLIKVSGDKILSYFNPVKPGVKYSYAASAAPSGEVYYANGYGVTKLDKSLKKEKFFYSAQAHLYGINAWAVGVDASEIKQGKRVAVFNKSSVLLLDQNLKLLFQYRYAPKFRQDFPTDLSIVPSRFFGQPDEKINLELFGFWPNEKVEISFSKNSYSVNVNNWGYGKLEIQVPDAEQGIILINAKGKDSNAGYQTTFKVQ